MAHTIGRNIVHASPEHLDRLRGTCLRLHMLLTPHAQASMDAGKIREGEMEAPLTVTLTTHEEVVLLQQAITLLHNQYASAHATSKRLHSK